MDTSQRRYLPAAGRDLFLPLYDPIVKLLGGDQARKRLIEQAELQPDTRVLEIGCGTGTLLTLMKRLYPRVDIVGLDPDPKALARAKRKSLKAAIDIQLDQGFSDELPYPNASFDRVFSSFMFHHLPEEEKQKTLQEVRRVLKRGGSFHMVDFAGPDAGHGGLARWIHSRHQLKDNSEAKIKALAYEAGFPDLKTVGYATMLFWRIVYYRASANPA